MNVILGSALMLTPANPHALSMVLRSKMVVTVKAIALAYLDIAIKIHANLIIKALK